MEEIYSNSHTRVYNRAILRGFVCICMYIHIGGAFNLRYSIFKDYSTFQNDMALGFGMSTRITMRDDIGYTVLGSFQILEIYSLFLEH